MQIKDKETKDGFIKYLKEHPEERFWQALRNWACIPFILASNDLEGKTAVDTYYWESDDKDL